MDPEWVDVFPIEHGNMMDIWLLCIMLVYQRFCTCHVLYLPGSRICDFWHHSVTGCCEAAPFLRSNGGVWGGAGPASWYIYVPGTRNNRFLMDGSLVISNHLLCNDSVHLPIETTLNKKLQCLEFQVSNLGVDEWMIWRKMNFEILMLLISP